MICLLLLTVVVGYITFYLFEREMKHVGQEEKCEKNLADLESQLVKFHVKHALSKVVQDSNASLSIDFRAEGNKHIYDLVAPKGGSRKWVDPQLHAEVEKIREEEKTDKTKLKSEEEAYSYLDRFRKKSWDKKSAFGKEAQQFRTWTLISSIILGGLIGELIAQMIGK